MGAVNSRAFALPGVRRSAMGYGKPKPIGYDDGSVGKTGGMRNPKRVELQPGATIVRFGQKRLSVPVTVVDHKGQDHTYGTNLSHRGLIGGALEGEWWLERAEFDRIADYAKHQRITIGAAVSALCVVPADWSDLDVVVAATLMAPLLAYRGLPNPVDIRGTHVPVVSDDSGKAIRQLFIPGLGNGDVVRQALMWGAPTFLHPLRGP